MSSLTQFRPTFYLVICLGLTGFCLAVESPGLWVLTIAAVLLHMWLVNTGRFFPLPRLVSSAITLAALAYTFHAIRTVPTPIIAIGQFLVLLQGVKLFEMRANRDNGQLLVLSLLLMVAGAISTASLAFGVIMIVYLFVSLYCCLLFHLKIEHEYTLAAQTLPIEKLNAATVRQDQRFLPRSMKKLAGLVAAVAIVFAVVVFLFFPRGTGAGMFGQLQFRPNQALTGFSDTVSFGQINSIAQNTEIVANVQVFHNGRLLEGAQPLYLRGKTLERYNSEDRRWEHRLATSFPRDNFSSPGETINLVNPLSIPATGDEYLQKISLRPHGAVALFALADPIQLTPSRDVGRIRYHFEDQTIEIPGTFLYQRFDYEVLSRSPLPPRPRTPRPIDYPKQRNDRAYPSGERITEYARRPEVSGVDEQGRALASLRPRDEVVTDLDARIAANVEKHLRTTFQYTLDLPSHATIDVRKDPIEQFIFDWKKGHCEYFASAMTLMLQGMGIQARMVTGFRCDEFDSGMGRYYIVRQSHAHAWVEVRTPSGWKAFDPTSSTLATGTRARTTWQAIKHFFNFLEFKWANSVIAYDTDRRENLISSIERSAGESAARGSSRLGRLWRKFTRTTDSIAQTIRRWFNTGQGQIVSAYLVMGIVVMVLGIGLIWIVSYFIRRLRMRHRAQRIGLDSLPVAERLRLARQLGFYERLMTVLERHRIVRPEHLTPAEFGRSLIHLPSRAYDTIREVTEAFYAVRFGRQELSATEQRELESAVDRMSPILEETVQVR